MDKTMQNFWRKPWVNPSGKSSIFLTFWSSCFHSLERRFFVLEYLKTNFPCLYYLKKEEKLPIFDRNHCLTPLEKSQFSAFWSSRLYSLECLFFVLQYPKTKREWSKTHFPDLYCHKKTWKNCQFVTKTMG